MLKTRGILSSLIMIGFIGFSLLSYAQDEVENLLNNGGFENDVPDPWKVGGKIRDEGGVGANLEVVDDLKGADVPEEPIEGDLCLDVEVPKAGEKLWHVQIMTANHPPVYEKGEIYTFSAFITSADNMRVQLTIGAGSEDNFDPTFESETFIMTKEWKEYHVTTSAFPKQPQSTRAKFYVGKDDGEFWIDNIKVYKDEYVPSELLTEKAIQPRDKLAVVWGQIKAD